MVLRAPAVVDGCAGPARLAGSGPGSWQKRRRSRHDLREAFSILLRPGSSFARRRNSSSTRRSSSRIASTPRPGRLGQEILDTRPGPSSRPLEAVGGCVHPGPIRRRALAHWELPRARMIGVSWFHPVADLVRGGPRRGARYPALPSTPRPAVRQARRLSQRLAGSITPFGPLNRHWLPVKARL